nr:unnamed protein product [uncultured bacterium]
METEYIIRDNKTLKDALVAINNKGKGAALTLFVVDEDDKMIGTLTDGDIRRSLIAGASMDTQVSHIAHKQFIHLSKGIYDIDIVHACKDKNIELLPILDSDMHIVDIVNFRQQKSILPLDAVLMAGGKGVRLRPLTETTPKPLLPVGGKPIIDYNIESLMENGVKHISVTVNYLHEQLEEHFAEPKNGVKIDCIKEL